jgi:hypothetical protein
MNGEGIMGVPTGGAPMPAPQARQLFSPEQASAIEFARSQTTPEEMSNETINALQQVDPALVLELKQALASAELPQQVIDALKMMVDEILADPASYAGLRAELLADPEVADAIGSLLPPTFDIAFFSGLRVALDQIRPSQGMGGMPGMMPVQGFAQGGIVELPAMKKVALELQQMGRGGDTILAHINPEEARMLKAMGGSGTINPYTGLPEFIIKKVFKAVVNTVKDTVKTVGKAVKGVADAVGNVVRKIADSPIGRAALTIAAVYFMGPAGLNLAAGTLGVTNAALAMGINTFAASTLVNLASGMKPGDALKQGLFAGVTAGVTTGVTQGFDAMAPGIPATPGTAVTPPAFPEGTAIPPQPGVAPGGVGTAADLAGNLGEGVPTATNTGFEFGSAMNPAAPIQQASAPIYTEQAPTILRGEVLPPTTPAAAPAPASAVTATTPSPTAASYVTSPSTQATVESALRPADYSLLPQTPAATPAVGAPAAAAPASTSGIGSLVDTGKGYLDKAVDFFSPAAREQAGIAEAANAANQAKAAYLTSPQATTAGADAVWQKTFEAAQPGMLSKYGPLAGAGFAATSLLGGFEQPPPEEDPLKEEREQYYESLNAVQPLQVGGGYYGTTEYTPIVATPAPVYVAKKGSGPAGVTNFPRKTGEISGPGTGTSDSIPAMLSDGEFVFTAKAVRNFGNGSRRKGAARMYKLMKMLEGGPVKKSGIASLEGAKRG